MLTLPAPSANPCTSVPGTEHQQLYSASSNQPVNVPTLHRKMKPKKVKSLAPAWNVF